VSFRNSTLSRLMPETVSYAGFAGFNRNAVTSQSPGLPLRLPWEREGKDFQPQSGCVMLPVDYTRDATALRLE
jgi:hypothetical protein